MTLITAHVNKVLILASTGLAVAQIQGPAAGQLDTVGRLSLDAALIIAVGVLWKAIKDARSSEELRMAEKDKRIAEKDAQLMAMTTKVTEVMVMVIETNKELRQSNDEIGQAMDNLASNIAALPCSMNQRDTDRAERVELLDRPKRKGDERR